MSLYAPACKNSRNWLAVAVVHEVRSAARSGFPGLDVIFSLAAPAVAILIEHTGVVGLEFVDVEACVRPVRAGFDVGDDPFDAAPACGPAAPRSGAPCCFWAWPQRVLSCWLRDRRYAGAMSWSRRHSGHNPCHSPGTRREPRDCNSDCRRAVGFRSSASWRGLCATGAGGRREPPSCRVVSRHEEPR